MKHYEYEEYPICPCCKHSHTDFEPTEFFDGYSESYTCTNCGKDFIVEYNVSITYNTWRHRNK